VFLCDLARKVAVPAPWSNLLADPNGLAGRQTAFALNSLGSTEPGVREANTIVLSLSEVITGADQLTWHDSAQNGEMREVRLS